MTIAWVYEGVPAVRKVGFKWDEVVMVEILRGSPDGILLVTLKNGATLNIKADTKTFLEHYASGSTLLLAPLEAPKA